MFVSGCAISGCRIETEIECDSDGKNCRPVIRFACDIGPQPRRPVPIPPFLSSSGPELPAVISTLLGDAVDTNGDGILSCEGTYDTLTGVLEASCV